MKKFSRVLRSFFALDSVQPPTPNFPAYWDEYHPSGRFEEPKNIFVRWNSRYRVVNSKAQSKPYTYRDVSSIQTNTIWVFQTWRVSHLLCRTWNLRKSNDVKNWCHLLILAFHSWSVVMMFPHTSSIHKSYRISSRSFKISRNDNTVHLTNHAQVSLYSYQSIQWSAVVYQRSSNSKV